MDLYWPLNKLHCAIYICFLVSSSYAFLWLSRFAQLQCGRYRIFGGSTANCSFEVTGFLVYLWMAFLSLKLIWYYDDVNGVRCRQLKASFFKSFLALLNHLQSAKKTVDLLQGTMLEIQSSALGSQVPSAVNLLRICQKRQFDGAERLPEAVVVYLSSLYPEGPERRRWLQSQVMNVNEANLSQKLSEDIIKHWQSFHEAQRKSLEACQEGRGIRIESATTLEEVQKLGARGTVKSLQLYVQKDTAVLEEIALDFDVVDEGARREGLSRKWIELQAPSQVPSQAIKQKSPLAFHALISETKSIDSLDMSLLPSCGCRPLRCCLPSIFYHIPRCLQGCCCCNQLPLLDPLYDDRRCSFGLCFLNLVSPLQEQLLTTACFASLCLVFNLTTMVWGVLHGCQSDALPCSQLLFQRAMGVLCTLIFIASTLFCLKRENFRCLEPLLCMFEMTCALEKLVVEAEDFQEALGDIDEICRRIQSKEKVKEAGGFVKLVLLFLSFLDTD